MGNDLRLFQKDPLPRPLADAEKSPLGDLG